MSGRVNASSPQDVLAALDDSAKLLPRAVEGVGQAVREAVDKKRSDFLAIDPATLGTILYSSDRKLAIVDGRIVQSGDEVRGARIVEITPTSVYLRDQQGRLRLLTAGGSDR